MITMLVCAACECGGKSDECYFDEDLFERTGHGGHCTNCRDDTFGVHCELCRESFYKDSEAGHCVYCACHPQGPFRFLSIFAVSKISAE